MFLKNLVQAHADVNRTYQQQLGREKWTMKDEMSFFDKTEVIFLYFLSGIFW